MLLLSHVPCVLLVLLYVGNLGSADEIVFGTTPAVISSSTQSVSLRCSITDNAATTPVISHITSIVISRSTVGTSNETVARVTAFDPASASVDAGNIQVNGNTESGTAGEHGYLEVTWPQLTPQQYGDYHCEVFALNLEDHPEEFYTTVYINVTVIEPGPETIPSEVWDYIAALENRTSELEQKVEVLEANSGSGSGGMSNFQTGIVECYQGTHDFPVTFDTPYTQTPLILTAVAGARSATGYVYPPAVVSPSATGFTLRCTSHEENSIRWIAVS